MKKRIFSIALALVLSLALAVPALAAEEPEPEYRLTKVVPSNQGVEYSLVYGQGGYMPTEVLRNGAPYVTASYDENGRVTAFQDSDESSAYDYDEDGNCVRSEFTYDYGDGPSTDVTEYSYDKDGNCVREDYTCTDSDGAVTTSVTEYTYDEAGNCVREEGTVDYGDGDVSTRVIEHTYDDVGNQVREEYTRTDSDGTVSTKITERTYDENDRILSETTTENGESSEVTYTYGEDGRTIKTYDNGNTAITYEAPLLEVTWAMESVTAPDGSVITLDSCHLLFVDSKGDILLFAICNCDGEPTLTYDDNGYLVKVDGVEETVDLTYEPVA